MKCAIVYGVNRVGKLYKVRSGANKNSGSFFSGESSYRIVKPVTEHEFLLKTQVGSTPTRARAALLKQHHNKNNICIYTYHIIGHNMAFSIIIFFFYFFLFSTLNKK